jgi:hypothetical protein
MGLRPVGVFCKSKTATLFLLKALARDYFEASGLSQENDKIFF